MTQDEWKQRHRTVGWCLAGVFGLAVAGSAMAPDRPKVETAAASGPQVRSVTHSEAIGGNIRVTFDNASAPVLMKEFVAQPFRCSKHVPDDDLDPDRICKVSMSRAVTLGIADRAEKFAFLMLNIKGDAEHAAGDGGISLDMVMRKLAETVEADPQRVSNSASVIKDKFLECLRTGPGQIVRIKGYQIMNDIIDGELVVEIRRY